MLAGKVIRTQVTINGVTYTTGDWINFDAFYAAQARRLAAQGIIDLVDYGVLMPKDKSIVMIGSSDYEQWANRLNIQRVNCEPYEIEADYGVMLNGKNPYVVNHPASFAAIVANSNYSLFAAIESYTMNMNQHSFKGKELVETWLPDLRIPTYSADWIIFKRDKAALATMKRYMALVHDEGLPRNIALTVALYLEKPLFWALPMEWR